MGSPTRAAASRTVSRSSGASWPAVCPPSAVPPILAALADPDAGTAWEGAQHLVRALDRDGETGAARLLARLGAVGGTARDLAYRLYVLCERKGWAQEALSYNALVIAWPEITRLAAQQDEQAAAPRQQEMFR